MLRTLMRKGNSANDIIDDFNVPERIYISYIFNYVVDVDSSIVVIGNA